MVGLLSGMNRNRIPAPRPGGPGTSRMPTGADPGPLPTAVQPPAQRGPAMGAAPSPAAPPPSPAPAAAAPPGQPGQETEGVPSQENEQPGDDAPAGANPMGKRKATPEEQATYNQAVDLAYKLIYDPKVLPGILSRLKQGARDPVGALVQVTVMVSMKVSDAARKAGVKASGPIQLCIGAEINADLADLAKKNGIHEYTPPEIKAAFLRLVDQYRVMQTKAGVLNTDGLKQHYNQIKQAAQAGTLNQVLPGLQPPPKPGAAPKPGSRQIQNHTARQAMPLAQAPVPPQPVANGAA